MMENKLAVVAITITNTQSIERVNAILHDFRDHVLGRMGIPLQDRGVSVISIIFKHIMVKGNHSCAKSTAIFVNISLIIRYCFGFSVVRQKICITNVVQSGEC